MQILTNIIIPCCCPIQYTGVDVDSFKSDMPLSPRQTLPSKTGVNSPLTQIHGKKVLVNGKEIALFYYNDEFYAVDEKCPHLGKSQMIEPL